MLDLIMLIFVFIFIGSAVLITIVEIVERTGLRLSIIEKISLKRLYGILFGGIFIMFIMIGVIYSNILPAGAQETLCSWLTSATRNAMDNACN